MVVWKFTTEQDAARYRGLEGATNIIMKSAQIDNHIQQYDGQLTLPEMIFY